jgi:predicted nucleic acid-binding protein
VILVDTNVLYALADRRDKHHARCAEWLQHTPDVLVDSDLRRMFGLVGQYADLRLGGTDASVVAICERLGIVTVATVNLWDSAAVRPRHVPAFITVPGLG